MRLAVLSDTRVPTVPEGGHGLGRFAIDMANALRKLGHQVTLYAGPGSSWDGTLFVHNDENLRASMDGYTFDPYDAILDLSHNHELSRRQPRRPVVNYIVDRECQYHPARAVVLNPNQLRQFYRAKHVHMGIDVTRVPFSDKPREHLSFISKIHPWKGVEEAMQVAVAVQMPMDWYGENLMGVHLPRYHGEIRGDDALYEVLGRTIALVCPTRKGLGARVALEAAACGTPTLCLDDEMSGMSAHVEDGVSGFVCANVADMIDAVQDLQYLDREKMRAWVREKFDINRTAREIAILLEAARDGEMW